MAPMPLGGAEVRFRQARNYLRIMEPLLEAELEDHDKRFSELLSEVFGKREGHPKFGGLAFEAASVAHERMEEARGQLPGVLHCWPMRSRLSRQCSAIASR